MTDIFDLIEIDVGDLVEAGTVVNVSASVEEIEAARILNAVASEDDFNPRHFLVQSGRVMTRERIGSPIGSSIGLIDPELMAKMGIHFGESNEEFRREFFPDREPPLFKSKIPEAYTPLPAKERVSERSLIMLSSYFSWVRERERVRANRRLRRMETRGDENRVRSGDTQHDGPKVAICAIAKNEARYLKEWVAYHHLIGFDPIRVYNHESEDDSSAVLDHLAECGLVEWKAWCAPPDKKPQWLAYEDGLASLRNRADWIAFIDLDEFIVTPRHPSIQEFLLEHDEMDAIAINWKMFGSAGHKTYEPRPVIERFDRCAEKSFSGNRAVKTLARVGAIEVPRVHTCHFRPGVSYETVIGEVLHPAEGSDMPMGKSKTVTHGTIRINHYFTRSREEWDEKAARGRGAKPANHPLKHRQIHEFEANDRNEEQEVDIVKLVPAVKELLAEVS